MVSRSGQTTPSGSMVVFWVIVGLAIVIFGFYLFNSSTFGIINLPTQATLADKLTQTKGFDELGSSPSKSLEILNYLVGRVPQYLISETSEASAGIITFGIWLMLFMTFSDIISVFGTFSKAVSWVMGFVLAVIATNLKAVMLIAVLSLTFTAGFGTLSVAAGLIIVFVVFLGVNLGIEPLRKYAKNRKIGEMKMRAAMGSAKAAAGLKALKDIDQAAVDNENN